MTNSVKGVLGLLVALVLVLSCSPKPTRVYETKLPQTQIEELRNQVLKGTVILDTRSPLEFYAQKVPGSILVEWKDFSIKLDGARGVLDSDNLNITRRLALWGIDPDTPVIVLGKWLSNNSDNNSSLVEEASFGRVAWMLKEMGVKNVKTFSFEMFRKEVPGLNETPPVNKSMWIPIGEIKSELSFDEFQRMLFPFNYAFKFYTLKRRDEKEGLRVGRIKNAKIHYLDVRSKEEFFKESLKTWDPTFPLIHFSWKEFYTSQGVVNKNIKTQLEKMGISESDIVVSISDQGVRSAASTFALLEMGYLDAKNYSGGYSYIRNSMQLEKQIHSVFYETEKKGKKRYRKKNSSRVRRRK